MAAEVEDSLRPNIRIEIHNNLSENMDMDVDELIQKSDNEEGEITEDNEVVETNVISKTNTELWPIKKPIFTTGINIFDRDEQEKLQERARRFALKPEEIHMFSDEDLQELRESLGITMDNESQVRFNALHMIGVKGMTTEDVLDYFVKYAPNDIEWINENSCNVVWSEIISVARAMHYVSKYVRGMPVRAPSNTFVREFLDEEEEVEKQTGESILLKNKNREVELKVDDILPLQSKPAPKNSADISEITIPVPPGYWRLGQQHPKSKCILLRYSLKTDQQPFTVESLAKYYKTIANKNVISDSKKKEIRSIFERNKELNSDKNPWGSLARNWEKDRQREREPTVPVGEQKIEIKNTKMLARLGVKKNNDNEIQEEEEEDIIEIVEKNPQEKKKIKIPRMKMYADEEEEKIKRKKVLQKIKQQAEKIEKQDNRNDLRSVLGISHRPIIEDKLSERTDMVDLGTRLKNRNKNMIYAVERDNEEVLDVRDEYIESKEHVQSDIRTLLVARAKNRNRSPVHRSHIHHRISPPPRSPVRRKRNDFREHSSERDWRRNNIEREHDTNRSYLKRRHSPERTLHSDRIRSRPLRRHRSRSYEDHTKPKSKVAVVIKTQKTPTVASTVWSRVTKPSDSEESSSSESESESEKSSESSSDNSDSESQKNSDSSIEKRRASLHVRPGFSNIKRRVIDKLDHRSPLKITMTNNHFKK